MTSVADSARPKAAVRPKEPGKFRPFVKKRWPVLPWAYNGDDQKKPLLGGLHGHHRSLADEATIRSWARDKRLCDCNPGLVMPEDRDAGLVVIGLDVDNHVKNGVVVDGLEALSKFEDDHGALPPTWRIFHGYTADDRPSPYGTRLYRVPASRLHLFRPGQIVGNLNQVTGLGGVDTVLPWLRYNAAPGSMHKNGEPYEFAGPDGSVLPLSEWPWPEDLPELNEAQCDALYEFSAGAKARRAAKGAARTPGDGTVTWEELFERVPDELDYRHWLKAHDDGSDPIPSKMHPRVRGAYNLWFDRESDAARHDSFRDASYALVMLAGERVSGSVAALRKVRKAFLAAFDDNDRVVDTEAADLIEGAVALAAAYEQWWSELTEQARERGDLLPVGPIINSGDIALFGHLVIERFYRDEQGIRTLRFIGGKRCLWHPGLGYRPLDDKQFEADLSKALQGKVYTNLGEITEVPLGDKYLAEIRGAVDRAMLSDDEVPLSTQRGVAFADGWFYLDSSLPKAKRLMPHTPLRPVVWMLPVPFGGADQSLAAWDKFLSSIGWPPGSPEYDTLQEWFGILLSGDLDRNAKILLLVGDTHSGKGTILQVMRFVLGPDNTAAGQLGMLDGPYAPEDWVGKRLAIFDDVRFPKRPGDHLVPHLLSISTFADSPINEKYIQRRTETLPTMMSMATNEANARFSGEVSRAIGTRFRHLKTQGSFTGDKQDVDLLDRLKGEAQGIILWAVEGYERYVANGHKFTNEPAYTEDMREQIGDDSADVRRFIKDAEWCERDPDAKVPKMLLLHAYRVWMEAEVGPRAIVKRNTFYNDLRTAFPGEITEKESTTGRTAEGFPATGTRDAFVGVRLTPEALRMAKLEAGEK